MNIVNIGTDKSLIGGRQLGDAIDRHINYGKYVDHLDVIVYSQRREALDVFVMANNVIGHASNSFGKFFFYFDAKKIFRKVHNSHKTDIVVCQDPFVPALVGVWAKKKFGVKLQINFHGDFWDNPLWLQERWINKIFLWISKKTILHADAIRVMSEGQKEKLIRFHVPREKIYVISTPVNMVRFDEYGRNNEDEKKLLKNLASSKMQKGKKMILHVGRKDKAKDFDTLFKAINIVYEKRNDVGLWLVGSYTHQELKNIFSKNLHIIISGRVDSADLPAYYKTSELIVLSSTSESFGKVLIEANACGKAVVSTATTGGKEVIEDGVNGYLVPIKDFQKLSERILYLLDHPEIAKEMGEKGRQLVKEKYGYNIQKIIKLWHTLVDMKDAS